MQHHLSSSADRIIPNMETPLKMLIINSLSLIYCAQESYRDWLTPGSILNIVVEVVGKRDRTESSRKASLRCASSRTLLINKTQSLFKTIPPHKDLKERIYISTIP